MLKTGSKIIPIFYHVDPSDLRYVDQGKGKYAHAFSEHERKGRYTPEKLDDWKRALHNTSFLSGYLVSNNEDEATVLKHIVNCTFQIMKKVPLWVAEHPVGLDELVQGFNLVAREEKVKLTGIVGIGGSGKTTLAKELFNRKFSSFERCSFVFDVRDAASKNALADKQKKLLADLRLHDLPFDSVDEGKVVLSNRLSSHRKLIVLDDVDHIDQLNALLPNKDNLGSQSMVIVTTRELGVLISWGLSCIYNMPGLDKPHAEQLFCWHAFLQPSPPAEFKTLVEDFLKACNGLPLSLKVFGAQLYGRRSKDYWKSQLHKILRILPGEIKQRLQVSYDALDEEEKEMFLDVACFLIGEKKSTAIAVWDGSGWSGLYGLETLVNKCLLELVEGDERIRMHDQLRDMGREIATIHSPCRLWSPQQINNMKKSSTKIKLIRGIKPADAFVAFKEYTQQVAGSSSRVSKHPRFSNALEILSVNGNEFTEEFASLSEELVWLRWEGFPLKNLPSWLILKKLSVLELHAADNLEELWQDNACPPLQLRELIIEGYQKLQWLPSSIGRLQSLKRLVIQYRGSSLPKEFCKIQSLEYLRLQSRLLSSLPDGFGNLISLRSMDLDSCSQLTLLPDSLSQLINLEALNLFGCEILSSLPLGFGNLISLKKLNLTICRQLSTLPDSFCQLMHLEVLVLVGCEMLSSLPAGFGNLVALRKIDLDSCIELRTLPDTFKQLIQLEDLNLSGCAKLKLRSDILENIRKLKVLNLSYCEELEELPHQIMNQTSLTKLYLDGCIKLRGVPTNMAELAKLSFLTIETQMWKSLQTSLVNSSSLKTIQILSSESKMASDTEAEESDTEDCKQFSRISISDDRFPNLENFESLEKVERLETLELICDTMLALKPCIQSIKVKERPRYIRIEGSVIRVVKPIVNSLEFPDLAFREVEEPADVDKFPDACDSDAFLCYVEEKEANDVERKMVHIFMVNTYSYRYRKNFAKSFFLEKCNIHGNFQGKEGMVVKGKGERVVEAFYQLLENLE
ncbi:hypothetical protein SUGI_0123490 [Cryptomeria japonica]|nr:hypothetical protein SUGI_0123490 [Cryptomeria japonica]